MIFFLDRKIVFKKIVINKITSYVLYVQDISADKMWSKDAAYPI